MSAELEHPKLKRFMECETKIIQYADLEQEDFQITEPTIYEIHWDGVKFEFLVSRKQGSKRAAVFGTGDVGGSKGKYQFPVFSRGTWAKDFSCNGIWYFDPTVYLGDAALCWCYGINERWYLRDIGKILQTILRKWDIPLEHVVFSGSSGGGFTAIMLATMLRGKAAVINPQFDATKWNPHMVEQLKQCALKVGEDLITERLNTVSFFQQQAFFPQLYIKQNVDALHDLNEQLMPFLHQTRELLFDCKDRLHLDFYNADGGHNAVPSKAETLCWIDDILEQPLLDMPVIKSTGHYVFNGKLYFYLDTGKKLRLSKDEKVYFAPLSGYRFLFQLILDKAVVQTSDWLDTPLYVFDLPEDGTYVIRYVVDDGMQQKSYLAKGIKVSNGSSPQPLTDAALKSIQHLNEILSNTPKADITSSDTNKEIKKIIFSIDTESGVGKLYRFSGNLRKYGFEENWGVSYIMDTLERRNMRAVFFVNVYEHASFGPEYGDYIQNLCHEIDARGHEVALHSHPNATLPFYHHFLYDYSLEQQAEIIRYGCNFIKQATGKSPVSFRGGAYRIDENTFLALEQNGIKIDSSCFYGRQANQRFQRYRSINQICKIGNIFEFPVLTVMNRNQISKLDIEWLSFEQLKSTIEHIKTIQGFPFIGIMFHSFTFLDETPGDGKVPLITTEKKSCYGTRPHIKERFEQLLDYIAQDDQLETATLRDCLEIGIDGAKIESDQMFVLGKTGINPLSGKIQAVQNANMFTFSLQNANPGDQYSWGIYDEHQQLRLETDTTGIPKFTYAARSGETVQVNLFITESSTKKRVSHQIAKISEHNGIYSLTEYSSKWCSSDSVLLPATPLKLRFRSDEISYSEKGNIFTFYNDRSEPNTEYSFSLLDSENKPLTHTPFSRKNSAIFTLEQYSGTVKIKAIAKHDGLMASRIAAEVFCDPENNIYKIDPSYRNPIRTDHS